MPLGSSVNRLLLDVVGSSTDAQRALSDVTDEIRKFGTTRAEAELDIAGGEAFAKLAAFREQLDSIDRSRVSAAVGVQIGGALAEIEALELRLARLDTEGVDIDVDVKRGVLEQLTSMEKKVAQLGGAFASSVKPGESLGEAATGLLLKLRALAPILSGLFILIGVSLVSALGALVASMAAAAGGVVVLANAFIMSFGPALLLVIAIAQRFAAILQAVQARKAAHDAAVRGGVSASKQAASADAAQANAAAALRDARQGVTRAHREYAEAVARARDSLREQIQAERDAHRATVEAARDVKRAGADVAAAREEARDRIVKADKDVHDSAAALRREIRDGAREIADAEERVVESNRKVADETVAAAKAQVDAQQDVIDRTLALRDAQLDLEDAQDAVGDKEREIQKLLKQMGATDPTEALKKLQNVDLQGSFDLSGLGLQGDEAQAEKLSDLMRELERAKLNVEKASNAQTKAERELSTAQATANEFAQKGLDAYDPLTAAKRDAKDAGDALALTEERVGERLGDARDRATEAAAELLKLTAAGVNGAPGVVSALEAQRDARQRLADARRREREEEDKLATLRAQGIAGNPAVIAAADGVRDAQERLADAHRHARDALRGQNAAAEAGAGAMAHYKDTMAQLTPAELEFFKTLVAAGAVLRGTLQPATDAVFGGMTAGLKALLPLLVALRPGLTALGGALGGVFAAIGKELSNPIWVDAMVQFVGAATKATKVLGTGIFLSFLRIMRDLGLAALPAMQRALNAVAHTLQGWQEHTSNIDRMRGAVDVMVGALGAWLSTIGKIAGAFGAFIRVVEPFGTGLVKWIGEGADKLKAWLNSKEGMEQVQGFFRDTLPFAKELVGFIVRLGIAALQVFRFFAPGLRDIFHGLNMILDGFNFLMGLLNRIPAPIRSVISMLLPIGSMLRGGMFAAKVAILGVEAALGLVTAAISLLGKIGDGTVGELLDSLGGIWGKVKALAGDLAQLGEWLLGKILDGFKAAPNLIATAVRWYFNTYKRLIEAELGALKAIGGWILNRVVDGFTTVTGALGAVGGWVKNRIEDLLHREIDALKAVGGWVLNRLADGMMAITTVFGAVGGWIKNRIENLIHSEIDGLKGIGSWIVNRLADGITTVTDLLGTVGGWLRGKLEGIIHDVEKGLKGIGGWVVNAVVSGVISTFQHSKDVANAFIDFLNRLLPDEINPPGPGKINLPNNPIRHLAAGGLVMGRTFAELGEGAYREAVLPLSRTVLRSLGESIAASMPRSALAGAAPVTMPGLSELMRLGRFEQHNHFPPAPGGDFPSIEVISAQLAAAARAQGGIPRP